MKMEISEINVWIEQTFGACTMTQKTDTPAITFLTSMGYIFGKKAVITPLDASSTDALRESIERTRGESGFFELDALSITHVLAAEANKNKDKVGVLVHLEDVTIYSHSNLTLAQPIGKLTLNPDQIIGIIPGKFETRTK